MKQFLCALFVIASLASLASVSNGSSASWGKRNGTEYLLLRENVVRTPLRNNYQSVTVNFPKSGQTNTKTITAIFVYDRFTNSSGAIPNLWSGGPGWRYASVNLKSQYNQGINSTVEFYGK